MHSVGANSNASITERKKGGGWSDLNITNGGFLTPKQKHRRGPARHLGEHLLHVESGAHAQSAEAPPYVGRLGAVALFRPVGIAVHAYQRNVVAEEMTGRQHRPVPTH